MGDLLKVSKERNNKNEYTKEQVLSASREVGTVNQIEYQGRSFAGADISGYKVVHLGQMIYTKSPLKDAPYGIFQNVTVEGIVSPLYAVYNSTDKALASFIGLQLKDDNLATHYLSPLVSKGAKNTINVTDEGALGGIVFHPSIAEQQEIIDFFTALDHLITLHQRECDLLLKTKKSYLQKMFPKNGEDKPEIRFVGFNDAWEQRELSELATMNARIGWQNLRSSEFLDSGDYMLITGTDFKDGTIDYSKIHYVDKERYDQDKKIQIKDESILITKDGTLGKVAYIQGLSMPATLNAGVFNVRVKADTKVDSKYLFHYLKAPFLLKFADEQSTGGTIKHLNQNVLVKFPIPLSSIEEQTKIGDFFTNLDHLITLHQRELDSLKDMKKSLLQQMFI